MGIDRPTDAFDMAEKPPHNQAWAMEGVGFRSRTFRIRYCYEEVRDTLNASW